MPEVGKPPEVFRFGPFELSVETGELRKNDVRLGVGGQPIEVLKLLIKTPGSLVTREELQRQIWPGSSYGDFEAGLNAAVFRLRTYLGDSAKEPKYIETVPSRGYRFIGRVLPAKQPGTYDIEPTEAQRKVDSSSPPLPSKEEPIAILEGELGNVRGHSFFLTKDMTDLLIGSSNDCDIVLGSHYLSRFHCKLTIRPADSGGADRERYKFTLIDCASYCGLQVNGERVKNAVLRHGDRIQLATLFFKFVILDCADQPSDANQVTSDGLSGRPARIQKGSLIEPLSYILVAYVPRESTLERAAEVVVWVRLGRPGDRYYMRQEKEPPPPLGGTFYEREFGLEVRSDASDSHPSTDVFLRLDSPNFEPSSQTKKLNIPGGADSHPCTFLIKPRLAGELVATVDVVDATERVLASRSVRTKVLYSENEALHPEFSMSFGVLRRIYEDLRQYPPNPPELQVINTPQALDIPHFTTACDDRQKQWEALRGQIALGRYPLTEFIGHGGTGAVFRSRDLALGSEVAVKIFYAVRPSELSALKESTMRSVRALASLSHPNLEKTLDVGVHETVAGEASLFVVSEFVKGETLEDALQFHRLPGCDAHSYGDVESAASDPSRLLNKVLFARQVAGGLLAAHSASFVGPNGFEEHGICHGDIKPSNILVEESGRAVIVDFMMPDIQRLIASQGRDEPRVQNPEFGWKFSNGRYFYRAYPTAAFGTVGFMPPEQELQGIVTRASDIYSLGRTYTLLLFADLRQSRAATFDLCLAFQQSQDPDLTGAVSQLPIFALRDLYIEAGRLIDSMTQPQPDQRLQDMKAVDGCLMQIEQKCRSAMLRAPESRTGLLNRLRWRPQKLD